MSIIPASRADSIEGRTPIHDPPFRFAFPVRDVDHLDPKNGFKDPPAVGGWWFSNVVRRKRKRKHLLKVWPCG